MKKYKRRYRKRTNIYKIMKNYFKTKLTTTDRILLGPNIWTFSADQGETLTARTVLKSCSEWTQFSAIFGFYEDNWNIVRDFSELCWYS